MSTMTSYYYVHTVYFICTHLMYRRFVRDSKLKKYIIGMHVYDSHAIMHGEPPMNLCFFFYKILITIYFFVPIYGIGLFLKIKTV